MRLIGLTGTAPMHGANGKWSRRRREPAASAALNKKKPPDDEVERLSSQKEKRP
jgi:hypothetical protein